MCGGGVGGVSVGPPAARPQIEMDREKNECVSGDKTKPMFPNFETLDHLLTSEVRSTTSIPICSFSRITFEQRILDQ